jgi:low affinity Fe/Cu permease
MRAQIPRSRGGYRVRLASLPGVITRWAGSIWLSLAALTVVFALLVTGLMSEFPTWWQTLVYSMGALVSLLMLFLIQHTTNRDTNAVLLKLDELISAIPAANEEAIDIEDREVFEQEEVHHRLHHETRAGAEMPDDQNLYTAVPGPEETREESMVSARRSGYVTATMNEQALLQTLTRVVTVLSENKIAFAVAGGCAVYARGGPVTTHDIDIFLREEDVPDSVRALEAAGMRPKDPPESWLTKVYDGDVLVDLIFCPNDRPVDIEFLSRAESMQIGPTRAPVVRATDLMVDKLLVLDSHRCDFGPILGIARAIREQVDWLQVHRSTQRSPYATAFLNLLAELDIVDLGSAKGDGGRQYDEAELRRRLAEDSRTAELGVTVTFNGQTLALDGEVDCPQRREMLSVVAREYAPDMDIRNMVRVSDTGKPGREELIS